MAMNNRLKDPLIDQLCQAILSLQTVEECYRFFEDVSTISELKAWAQRLEVARMLNEGATYEKIAEETGASTATISRVKKYLHYGADGYKIILERIKREDI